MAKLKATPKSFAEALDWTWHNGRASGKNSIRIGNNTYLECIAEADNCCKIAAFAVRLHNTEIIKFWANGRVTLHTGGYRTVTTKERINQFVDGRLHQKNGNWFYTFPHFMGGEWVDVPFEEGMFITHERS